MKKVSLFCSALIASVVLSGNAFAQQFKIGYVSLDRLMAESAPAKAARSALDAQFKAREKGLDAKAAVIRAKQQAYEKDFPNLTDDKRTEREKDLSQTMQAFESDRSKFEADLSAAQNKLLQDLLAQANSVIKSISEKEGIDLVVQDAVYIKPEYDLTKRVISELH